MVAGLVVKGKHRWINRTKDAHKARCTLCLKDIDVSSMRESPWKLVLESLKVPGQSLNFIFKNKWEPCHRMSVTSRDYASIA